MAYGQVSPKKAMLVSYILIIGAVTDVITSGILIDAHGNYKLLFYYIIVLCLVGIFSTLNFIKSKNM